MNTFTYDQIRKLSFRDSLFESVNLDKDFSLDFKIITNQIKKDIEPLIMELARWSSGINNFIIEDDSSDVDPNKEIIDKFIKNYNGLTDKNVWDINGKIKIQQGIAPKGFLNKILNAIRKGLAYVNKKLTTNIEAKAQAAIKKLWNKIPDDSNIKKLLIILGKIAKFGGKIATAVLILTIAITPFCSLPAIIVSHLLVAKIVAIATRIAVDLGSGKSLLYSIGKLLAIVEVGSFVGDMIQYANIHLPGVESHCASNPDLRINDSPDEGWVDAPASTSGSPNVNLGTVDTPGGAVAGGGQFTIPTPDATPSVSLTTPLEQAYGENIPDYQGDFKTAFAKARSDLGTGKLFHWQNDVYPTNYKEEGFFKGFSDAVKQMLQQGKK